MSDLPLTLVAWYRPATDREVRSWSFGLLQAIRQPDATSWGQQLGTLDDQRIFGPRQELACSCGKYRGPSCRNLVCDICGVKVTTLEARRQRFGHIELPVSIAHPLGGEAQRLSTFPVLPASFVESSGGEPLARLYEDLVRAVDSESLERLQAGMNHLIESLLPVLSIAHAWDLQEAGTIARGLALEVRTGASDDRCLHCGYPLAGLSTLICPGCGRRWQSR